MSDLLLWQVPRKGFVPTQINGLRLWLKADAIGGLANTDPVPIWEDSSVLGNDLTQGTGAAQPTYRTNVINGLPAVRFDGANDVLLGTSSDTFRQFFIVAKYSAATFVAYDGLITGTAAAGSGIVLIGEGGSAIFYDEGAFNSSYYFNGASLSETAMTGPMNAFAVMSVTQDTTDWTITPQLGQDRNQAARFWLGDICEVLGYSSILSAADRNFVTRYLGLKYAIGVST